jgi:hypothetical protein
MILLFYILNHRINHIGLHFKEPFSHKKRGCFIFYETASFKIFLILVISTSSNHCTSEADR